VPNVWWTHGNANIAMDICMSDKYEVKTCLSKKYVIETYRSEEWVSDTCDTKKF
jgi:hypothetical protein